jgi:hypothetical protein
MNCGKRLKTNVIKMSNVSVDRNQFINWCKGVFLDLRNGKGIVVNETLCQKAEDELKAGKKITLTLNYEPVSTVEMVGEVFVESALE